MSTGQFHKLLSPLSLGSGLTLKNRMIKAPQSSWFFEDDGSAGDRVIDFYEAIALSLIHILKGDNLFFSQCSG